MKVLWIVNALMPEVAEKLTGRGESNSTGSWLCALVDNIRYVDEVELYIVATSNLVDDIRTIVVDRINYIVIPKLSDDQKYCNKYVNYWKQIHNIVNPDVVHIHGTERPLGLSYVNACGSKHVVVSIQGMPSVISDYYLAGMSIVDIYKNLTIHDIIKRSGLAQEKERMKKCGEYEVELLTKIQHVIGRTSWDKAHCFAINRSLKYHFCNESLRAPFYDGKWDYNLCEKHSIFVTQAGYPLKGVHNLLKALHKVVKIYPDTQVYIAGKDMIAHKGINQILRYQTYGRYLFRLINRYNIKSHISFIGPQNAENVKKYLLRANIFVSPSSIENSPNSVGEAQLLGTPIVCSNVGGVPDFVPNENFGYLYRFEDIDMLYYNICRAFEESRLFDNSTMIKEARLRHCHKTNVECLINIYKEINE